MGTGKTVVGRVLASRLSRELVDTDAVIVERAGPVTEIFDRLGETGFRELEREMARELVGRTDLVIATGGAMMLDPVSRAALAATGDAVCLTADVVTIVERITASRGRSLRPRLADGDLQAVVETLLAERAEGYSCFPAVDTTGRSPDEVADAVLVVIAAL